MLKKGNSVDKKIILIESLFVLDLRSHIHLNQRRNYNSGVVSAKYTCIRWAYCQVPIGYMCNSVDPFYVAGLFNVITAYSVVEHPPPGGRWGNTCEN